MITWILNRVEEAPSSLFRRTELFKQSKAKFNKLKKAGFLLYDQPDEDGMSYPCPVPDCGNGCSMDVMEMKGKIYAVCPEDDGVKPIPLTEDDISRYSFSIEKLIQKVRRDNNFTGSTYQITPHLHFIGERVVNEQNTAFIFACFTNIRAAEPHLLALPARLPGQYTKIVVVTPTLDLSREPIYLKLRAASIFPLTLPATFGKKNFKFTYLAALNRRPPAGIPTPTPGLTPKQQADYEKYNYECRDRLHIPGIFPMKKLNLVLVNGQEIRLGDKLFALLMALVLKLKKGKGGWVHMSVLKDAGCINDLEHRQPISHLRTALKGSLQEKDGLKFIKSDRAKQLRLSTHPDFVTYDKKNLKTHPDPNVQKLFGVK